MFTVSNRLPCFFCDLFDYFWDENQHILGSNRLLARIRPLGIKIRRLRDQGVRVTGLFGVLYSLHLGNDETESYLVL